MHLPFYIVAAVIFLVDQMCKALIEARIPLGERIEIVPGKLSLTNVRNLGAANGLFADNRRALMFFSAAAVYSEIKMFFELAKHFKHNKAAWLMFAMNTGGGASNLLDRIIGKHTTDYLHFFPHKKIPVVNIADIFIITGALGLIIIYVKRLILNVMTNNCS